MHILVIPSAYPTEDAPLRSSFFKEQAVALSKHGHKVGVIYSETRPIHKINYKNIKKNHFQVTEYNEVGVNTIRLHGWNILMMRNRFGINLWIKQSLSLFNKYFKKYGKPDIIHVHAGLYGGKVAELIKKKYGIPYAITEHSSLILNDLPNKYQVELIKSSYNNANALISVGNNLKVAMKKYDEREIYVVPNIVNTEAFYNNKNLKKDKFQFISVCLLTKNKNVDLSIRAFAKNFKDQNDFEFVVVGDGIEKENLVALAKELGVEEQVKFIGAVNREELPKYLQQANIFVLPSKYETFGVAYIEALSCGVPIIATKCGGPEDFYNENLGYIIPVNDLDALSIVMKKSVDEENKFDRDEISRYIKNKFSEELIVESLEEIYSKVSNNSK